MSKQKDEAIYRKGWNDGFAKGAAAARFKLESENAELREEVVWCRDCKHCRRDNSRWYCSELMFDIDWVTSDTAPDGFCAWGERKGK